MTYQPTPSDRDLAALSAAHRRSVIGMTLFLAALGMLFASSMLGYLIVRLQGQQSPAAGTIQVPHGFYLSTLLIVISSFTIQLALHAVRTRRPAVFRRWLLITLLFAMGFVAVQTPCMVSLLHEHKKFSAVGMHLYGLIFFLVILHALHVLGGIIALLWITARGGQYDSTRHTPVQFTAVYWHFLDFVWLVMFGVLLVTR